MVYRFLQAVKRTAVLSQLRLGPPRNYRQLDPEPRSLDVAYTPGHDTTDDWLFDGPAQPLSPHIAGLSQQLDRVSGSLGMLRTLLAEMERFELADTIAVNAVEVPMIEGEAGFLFENTTLPRLDGDVPIISGDAVFLFEESEHPADLSVFDSPLMEKRLAA